MQIEDFLRDLPTAVYYQTMDLHLNLLKVIKNPGLIKLETKGTFLQMHRQLVDTFLGIEIQGKKSL